MKFRALLAATVVGLMISGAALAQTKDSLSIDIPNEPATLDPHVQYDTDSYSVYRNIFDNLVTRDVSGKIVPQVATSWKYQNDNVIDFTLRTDIKFHDGTPLTAEDVAFSINRVIDPAFKSPQFANFNSIAKAEVEGPSIVRVTTGKPYPALMAQLVNLSIVPEAYVKKLGNAQFNLTPMGSGPYKFVSWQKGVSVELAANSTYWGPKAPFKSVVFHDVPNAGTRIADLKTGRADFIRQLSPDDTLQLKGDSNLKVLSVPTERIAYLYFNTLASASKDVRVRKAMAMAIDRNLMISSLLGGYAKPVESIGAPSIFGYQPDIKGYSYDPDGAKKLIKDANAVGAEITFLTSPAYDQRIVQAVQQMLGDVGLKVVIANSDQRTFLQRRQGRPDEAGSMAYGRWSCACQDEDGIILPLFESHSIWSKYNNPDFDKAVIDARSTLDEKQRMKDYHDAAVMIQNDVPGLGLYQDVAIYASRKELQWTPTANEAFFLNQMNWKP